MGTRGDPASENDAWERNHETTATNGRETPGGPANNAEGRRADRRMYGPKRGPNKQRDDREYSGKEGWGAVVGCRLYGRAKIMADRKIREEPNKRREGEKGGRVQK